MRYQKVKGRIQPADDLYFVEAWAVGMVKIGRAKDPAKRLADLQVGSPVPLRLALALPKLGPFEVEMHQAFKSQRVRAVEWLRGFGLELPEGVVIQ